MSSASVICTGQTGARGLKSRGVVWTAWIALPWWWTTFCGPTASRWVRTSSNTWFLGLVGENLEPHGRLLHGQTSPTSVCTGWTPSCTCCPASVWMEEHDAPSSTARSRSHTPSLWPCLRWVMVKNWLPETSWVASVEPAIQLGRKIYFFRKSCFRKKSV